MLGYAEQLQRSTVYLRPSARRAVRFAVEVAYLSHKNQTRRSGEPFVTHPVAVAAILAETRMDRDTVVSGLLHDTVEDTELTFEEVEAMFGTDVRNIVEGETKVSKLPKMARELDSPSRAGREPTDAFQLHGRRSGSRRRRGARRGYSEGRPNARGADEGRETVVERKSSPDGLGPRSTRGGSRRRRGARRGYSEGN